MTCQSKYEKGDFPLEFHLIDLIQGGLGQGSQFMATLRSIGHSMDASREVIDSTKVELLWFFVENLQK